MSSIYPISTCTCSQPSRTMGNFEYIRYRNEEKFHLMKIKDYDNCDEEKPEV